MKGRVCSKGEVVLLRGLGAIVFVCSLFILIKFFAEILFEHRE